MRRFRRRREAAQKSRPELARQVRNPGEGHVLGGRTFLVVGDSTVEQDLTIDALLRKSGIGEIILEPGETPQAFALRLLDTAVRSGDVLQLLGCLLIPEEYAAGAAEPGDAWSLEVAEETTRFIGGLHSPQDKADVRSLILSLLISFFDEGIDSSPSSATSSESIPDQTRSGLRPESQSDTVPGQT